MDKKLNQVTPCCAMPIISQPNDRFLNIRLKLGTGFIHRHQIRSSTGQLFILMDITEFQSSSLPESWKLRPLAVNTKDYKKCNYRAFGNVLKCFGWLFLGWSPPFPPLPLPFRRRLLALALTLSMLWCLQALLINEAQYFSLCLSIVEET